MISIKKFTAQLWFIKLNNQLALHSVLETMTYKTLTSYAIAENYGSRSPPKHPCYGIYFSTGLLSSIEEMQRGSSSELASV